MGGVAGAGELVDHAVAVVIEAVAALSDEIQHGTVARVRAVGQAIAIVVSAVGARGDAALF
jgi:hypothetical protein